MSLLTETCVFPLLEICLEIYLDFATCAADLSVGSSHLHKARQTKKGMLSYAYCTIVVKCTKSLAKFEVVSFRAQITLNRRKTHKILDK